VTCNLIYHQTTIIHTSKLSIHNFTMAEHQGPLDAIPKTNYQSLLTIANYYSTKQMIEQVLSEDQDYVSWKLKENRTGGTMNAFLNFDNYNFGPGPEPEQVPDNKLNRVPADLTFVEDEYDEIRDEEIKSIEKGNDNPEQLSNDEQFKLLVLNLDEDQSNRFEVFHRTSLNKGQVKKLATTVCNQTIGENLRVFLQAIGKVFAGEIIELALEARRKWFIGKMVCEFDRRKEIGQRLKKYLKKLTILVEKNNSNTNDNNNNLEFNVNELFENDSVEENESDSYYDDEEAEMKEVQMGNKLLKSEKNTQEIRSGLITRYNKLVKAFNSLDISFEKYQNSPLLPEHVRQASRLYHLQKEGVITNAWRGQGEASGTMFR